MYIVFYIIWAILSYFLIKAEHGVYNDFPMLLEKQKKDSCRIVYQLQKRRAEYVSLSSREDSRAELFEEIVENL